MIYKENIGTIQAGSKANDSCFTFNLLSRAVKLIECSLAWSLRLFFMYGELFYAKMVEKELQMTDLKPGAKVLHIGAGSVPYTVFYLSKKGFLAKGIDHDPRTVSAANRLLCSLGACGEAEIETMEGLHSEAGDYDAVWISLHVQDKQHIIDRLKQTMGQDCFIVYREPRAWMNLFYKKTENPCQNKGFLTKSCKNKLGKQSIAIQNIGVKT